MCELPTMGAVLPAPAQPRYAGRVICVQGHSGAGKSLLVSQVCPDAVALKPDHVPPGLSAQLVAGLPACTYKVHPGDSVLYPDLMLSGEPLRYTTDTTTRNRARSLLGIGCLESVVHINASGGYAAGVWDQLTAALSARFDVVLYDFTPPPGCATQVTMVGLSIPFEVLESRSRNPLWAATGRTIPDAGIHAAMERYVRGLPSILVWSERDTMWETPAEAVDSLLPWYEHFTLMGASTGQHLNCEARYSHYRRCMPQSINGLTVVDVGANAGFNTLCLAGEGAIVKAVEASTLAHAQWDLVRRFDSKATKSNLDRITYIREPVQSVCLSSKADVVLMGAVHYHVASSTVPPYRGPREDYGIPELVPSLAVVFEDILESGALLVLGTNYPRSVGSEAAQRLSTPEWIMETLARVGFKNVRLWPERHGLLSVVLAGGGEGCR